MSRHVIISHVKTGSTCSHGKFSLAAARHAIVFDKYMAIPIATIAISDYGRTNDIPDKGQSPKVSRPRVMHLYSTNI